MKIAIRCQSLDFSTLAAQETHGKREDEISKRGDRIVRNVPPLVLGSLELRKEYDKHMHEVRQNAAAKKPVLHFIMCFPKEALDQDFGHFKGDKSSRQEMMMRQAVAFIQRTHGGSAVFSARVDRDEAGETIVDVFASPKYEKRTKRTKIDEKGVMWASASKYGKELALKHSDEIHRRHPKAEKGSLTSPRAVGIALNSEFRSFFEKVNKITLDAKVEKIKGAPDRLEIEAYKRVKDEEARVNTRLDAAEDQIDAERRVFEAEKTAFMKVSDRMFSAVEWLCERLGIVAPSDIHSRMEALEGEVERMRAEDLRDLDQGPSM